MKKKYFTEEEKRLAKNKQQNKYYDKVKNPQPTLEEKKIIKLESTKKKEKYLKEYYIQNKEKILTYSKEYFKKNKEEKLRKNNERYKKRREENPVFKLSTNIKRRIRESLTRNGFKKNSKTLKILGCSFEYFKIHLESKFDSWMDWENYGKYNGVGEYGWDIDHIIPLSSAKTEEEVYRLNHYSNLQPLCSHFNRDIKRDNVITVQKENNISKLTLK